MPDSAFPNRSTHRAARRAAFGGCCIILMLSSHAAGRIRAPEDKASPPIKREVTTRSARIMEGATPDWPMFRGNSEQTGVSRAALPDDLALAWKFTAEEREPFTATVAIRGGRVYAGGEDGRLYALRIEEGSLIWKCQTSNAAIKSSPTVFGEYVMFGDEDGVFHALDSTTGRPAWTFKAEGEIISSPNPAGDRVVFGSYDGCVYCLSIRDGRLLWKFTTEAQIHGTVAVCKDAVVVGGCDGKLHVLSLRDGTEVRSAAVGAQTASSPAIVGHCAYLGTLGNQVLGIDWTEGKLLWTFENADRNFPFHSSAAVTASRVFIGGRDKCVYGLDASNGKLVWTFRTQGRVDSSPVLVGDRLYFGSGDGRLYALSSADGKAIWQYDSGSAFSASPAIGEGRLVIGDEDGTLYCFGAKARSK